MLIPVDMLFFITELTGTIAFAISGATLAIERRLDLFGVVFLGTTTAIGGGIMRDIMLDQTPPQSFQHYIYMVTAISTSLLVFYIHYINNKRSVLFPPFSQQILNVFDAAGLGIFSVIGVQNTINAGFSNNPLYCVFLGMLTGVGGGILRDILSHATPAVLYKHIYALPSILGAVLYYYLQNFNYWFSIFITTLLVVILRVLASHFRWTLPHIPDTTQKENSF